MLFRILVRAKPAQADGDEKLAVATSGCHACVPALYGLSAYLLWYMRWFAGPRLATSKCAPQANLSTEGGRREAAAEFDPRTAFEIGQAA